MNETIIPTNSSEQFLFEFCPDDGEISYDYGCGDRINVYSVSVHLEKKIYFLEDGIIVDANLMITIKLIDTSDMAESVDSPVF